MAGPATSAAPTVSVVVPTFRSAGTLERLCDAIHDTIAPLFGDLEVILVDDGNVDATWPTITALAARHHWVRGVRLLRNYGQHNALMAGFRHATHDLVLTIDDDLQNPPDQVGLLLAALTDDIDLVYGTPHEQPHGALRGLASTATKRVMASMLGPDVFPRSSAFRLFRRELLGAAQSVGDPFISIDVMLSWATTRITAVEVRFDVRTEGQSGYTFRKLVKHAFNMITGYSTRPLRVVSMLGVSVSLVGFALLVFVLGRYAFGDAEVAGFTFLAAAVTLFSGVQLLSLGVLGEYMARMHFRSMGRPPFVVRATTDGGTGGPAA